ncbi:hypothetical protein [Bacteroides sp.]|uniref:hypothetical protein n=1 Tax=Bacteroides sp. TaxID=29523 RepID=UPI0023C3C94D|nr:hypothetical protein [Bacteroides sp.]MDE6216066.1 hypothetical protein [Bacteroides sp.]
MKYRINFNIRYALPMLLLLWMAFGTGSCVREDFVNDTKDGNYSSMTIKVKTPKPIATDPTTRATVSEFDEIGDMNIIIADKGSIKDRIFLDFTTITTSETPLKIEGKFGVTITSKTLDNGYQEFELYFAEEYWTANPEIPLKDCQFYAVANWGSKIESTLVSQLRNLRTEDEVRTAADGDHSFVPTPNAMFGEIAKEWTTPIVDKPGEVCRNLQIELKRTAAMITLAMDGTDLNKGVVIELIDVTLHNVPTGCTLGKSNKVADDSAPLTPLPDLIMPLGERKGGGVVAQGKRLTGSETLDWTNFNESDGYASTIGKHYTNPDDSNSREGIEYTDPTVQPFFLFENMHKAEFGASGVNADNQWEKRPAGVGNSIDAIAQNTSTCSYIEVNASYTLYEEDADNTNMGKVKERGTATWRFFLGGNEYNDFDVKRNTYYRLTLKLSNTGVGEKDYSWRVDSETKPAQVVGDANMVVGGGGEMFCVELTDFNFNKLKLVDVDPNNPADFVYIYAKNGGKLDWYSVNTYKGAGDFETIDNKQIWFYVQPLLPEDYAYEQGNERSCTIRFEEQNHTERAVVSFTQYRPVAFSITPQDLENYPNDPDLMAAHDIVKTYYNHEVNEANGEFKFYADRVDRGPMQWGFDGTILDKNQNTGFENVYHLIKPLDENMQPTCSLHIERAEEYLPTGKGTKEGNHINYDKGSCMMHAAMENYFQQYYPKPASDITPSKLVGVTLGQVYRPGSEDDPTPTDKRYSWCVPSIVGWQLVEKLDRFYKRYNIEDRGFDKKYPITKWTSYWTSNAATADLIEMYPDLTPAIDGKNRSFVYQFDMDLDDYKFDWASVGNMPTPYYPAYLLMQRTAMLKYRLFNIRPDSSN